MSDTDNLSRETQEKLIKEFPILKFFSYGHLNPDISAIARNFAALAFDMAYINKDRRSAEVSAGLRKLLEAKDCFVRAAL